MSLDLHLWISYKEKRGPVYSSKKIKKRYWTRVNGFEVQMTMRNCMDFTCGIQYKNERRVVLKLIKQSKS